MICQWQPKLNKKHHVYAAFQNLNLLICHNFGPLMIQFVNYKHIWSKLITPSSICNFESSDMSEPYVCIKFYWGHDHQTYFWKGTIQWSFHQCLGAFGRAVSEDRFLKYFLAEFSIFRNSSYAGRRSGSPNIIWEGDHPRIIPHKFECNWSSGFREAL